MLFPHCNQVDVQVHLSPDQERDARTAMAVALAESARQLAQSAADFGKEEDMEVRVCAECHLVRHVNMQGVSID